jgi:predicted unusual protein kinase regulating ubiquinone biosynthesis (AarF/ABC1/UbiB family)
MTYDDSDSFGGRLGRYARVTGTVGGLAARLAGEKFLGLKIDRDQHADNLRQALGGLKGPLMKVAQILSTIPGALPEEYASQLAELQANAPAMGGLFVRRRMASELGPDWRQKFGSFEETAAAAASLGQVHRATSLAGRDLACKLQYPDMQSAVEADLRQLKLVFGIFESYDRAITTGNIQQELADRLREELDYQREARNIALYHHMLAGIDGVSVPTVLPELSTKRLLTMEWLPGTPIAASMDRPLAARNELARAMFRSWYYPFYKFGVIHGDPHLGNYTVRDQGGINLLDFGCVRIFPPRFVQGVIDLYRALWTNDEALAVHAYETWGFTNLSRELLDTLTIWARFIYDPLLEDCVRLIGKDDHGIYGREKAEQVHKELRRLGGVSVPREFVFIDRAALGLGSAFLRLQAELNWHELLEELIAGFDTEMLAARQAEALKVADLA